MLVANNNLIVKTKKQILISPLLEGRADKYRNIKSVYFYELNINGAYYFLQ